MKNFLLFLLLSIPFANYAQTVSIVCPADVTVHLFDLDEDYDSYGDPEVITTDSYTLEAQYVQYVNSCVERYTEITYTATGSTGTSAWCMQTISVTDPTFEDFSLPEDITINNFSFEEATPELTGYPEPWEFLGGSSYLQAAYNDTRINPSPGTDIGKILRDWTFLDWCSADIYSHTQLIKIENLDDSASNSLFEINSCHGRPVSVHDVYVTTNDTNVTIDQTVCPVSSDIAAHLNCVAENNPIAADKYYELQLINSDSYLNGVTTLDLVQTTRHILAITQLSSTCQTLAADVNNDKKITSLDILLMRKLILGIDDAFSNVPSWIFYNDNGTADNDLKFSPAEFPLSGLNITATKSGDVNGTAN